MKTKINRIIKEIKTHCDTVEHRKGKLPENLESLKNKSNSLVSLGNLENGLRALEEALEYSKTLTTWGYRKELEIPLGMVKELLKGVKV